MVILKMSLTDEAELKGLGENLDSDEEYTRIEDAERTSRYKGHLLIREGGTSSPENDPSFIDPMMMAGKFHTYILPRI